MDFKAHIEKAWKLTLEHIVTLILMTLVMVAVSTITVGILAPVTMAGYMHAVLRMVREGREPKIQDIFSQMRLFFPLLGFGIAVFILSVIGFMLLVIPGIVVTVAVAFFCLYMIPLMVDKNMELIPAVKQSAAMVRQDPVMDHIIVAVLFLGISTLGGSVFIGWLFTQPLATIFLMSVYDEQVKAETNRPTGLSQPA